MGEAARRRLTVEDWLAFDDGTDTQYELFGGELVAMASSSDRHGTIAQNVGDVIQEAVRGRPPCWAVQGAGVEVEVHGDRRGYVADVLMTCKPASDDPVQREPRLIVEILSPSTAGIDKHRKVPDYGHLPTVEEIWLVNSRMRTVLVWHRV